MTALEFTVTSPVELTFVGTDKKATYAIDVRTCSNVLLTKLIHALPDGVNTYLSTPETAATAEIKKHVKLLKALNDFGSPKITLARTEVLSIIQLLWSLQSTLETAGPQHITILEGSTPWEHRNSIGMRAIDAKRAVTIDQAGRVKTGDSADADGTLQLADVDELRVVSGENGVSKLIGVTDGPGNWTFTDLLEIGSYLHESPELRFIAPDDVHHVGWVMFNNPNVLPDRTDLVEAIARITSKWAQVCDNDTHCIKVPNRTMVKDTDMRKILMSMHRLQIRSKIQKKYVEKGDTKTSDDIDKEVEARMKKEMAATTI